MIVEINWFAFYALIVAGAITAGSLSYLVAIVREPRKAKATDMAERSLRGPAADGERHRRTAA